MSKNKYNIIMAVCFSIFLLFSVSSKVVMSKQTQITDNMFFVLRNYQYLTFYDNENISLDIVVVDSGKYLRNKNIKCSLFSSDNIEIRATIDNITDLSDNLDINYNVYSLNLTFNSNVIRNNKLTLNSIKFNSEGMSVSLDIGTVTIATIPHIDNLNISVLSTIYSTDEKSFSIIVTNNNEKAIEVRNMDFGKINLIDPNKLCSIESKEEKEIPLEIKSDLRNYNIVLKPKMSVYIDGQLYYVTTNYGIHFKSSLSRKEVIELLKEEM